MSGMTPSPAVAGSAISGSRLPLARVEKASESNGLNNGPPTDEERREAASQQMRRSSVSQSGTGTASRWNGPRWSAPFVAQILGQVLAQNGPDTVSARAAYASAKRMHAGGSVDREA